MRLDLWSTLSLLVWSLSVKNLQDRDKADKVSILFPRDSSGQLKCFWGCNEEVQKFITPGVGEGGGGCEKSTFLK